MNKVLPAEIHSVVFQNPIWGIVYNNETNSLIVDSRNEESKEIKVSQLEMNSFEKNPTQIALVWWERLVGIKYGQLYSVKYESENDPSNYSLKQIDLATGKKELIKDLPEISSPSLEPALYEMDSEHHQTVAQFLAIELPLPCEYLEFENNIIISYYLRSEQGFERFLLLLQDGQKKWKVKQDSQMKGFSSGAFFVIHDKLVFVRDRNEVCIYSF